ncbi:MAG: PAS domain S-box protein [Promethearchaeota archaeon]|jgi:PAS domain S-box-containing protein
MANIIGNINKINQLISENIDDLIFILTEDFICEYINFEELRAKKPIFDFLHPEDSNRVKKFLKNLLKLGVGREESRIKVKNRQFEWYEVKGKSFIDENNKMKVFLICREITQFKIIEEEFKVSQMRYAQLTDALPEIKYWKLLQSKEGIKAVEKSRKMLELVIDNIPQLIYWKDHKLKYLGCNTKFAQLNKLENPSAIVGRSDNDFSWLKEKIAYIQECEQGAMKLNKPEYNVIELFTTAEEKERWFEINRIPLHDLKENVVGILVTYEDITIRKISEQKLKESEEKYRNLVINLTDIVLEIDLKGIVTYVSPQSNDILGYYPTEIIGKNAFQFIHPEDVPKAAELLKKGIETKEMISIPMYRLLHKNGDIRVVSARGKYVSTNGNERIIAAIRDITNKTQIEEKLKESEENYRTIFNSSPDYIFITDVEGIILDMNLSLLKRIGMTLDEVCGINFSQFYVGDNLEDLLLVRDEIKSGKEIIGTEVKARAKTGEIFEYEVNSVPIKENGRVVKVINLARDVTDKKIAEQKLKESEIKYRHLFENSPYSIILINRKGEIIDCNPATEKIFNNKIEELINRNFLDVGIKPEENLAIYQQRYRSLLEGVIPDPIEIQISRYGDGCLIWTGITESLVDIGGETVFQVIIQDINEKKIAEQKLKKSQEELQVLNKDLELKVKERTKDFIESERQYRTTIDYLGDSLHVIDRNLKIILVNKALKKWLNQLEIDSDIVGKKISEVFPFLPDIIYEEYEGVFETGAPLKTMETTILPGLDVITETRKIPIFREGKVEQIITIIRDVTEAKKTEVQLKVSEEKFRNSLNNLDVGFYKGELKGELIVHNQAFNRIIGLKPNESAVGMKASRFLIDQETQKKYYDKLEKNGFVRNFIGQIRNKEGKIITIDINAHLIYNPEGKPIEVEGTFSDITEKFKLQQDLLESEKKLREQNVELMKLDQIKNDFITMAAHELKTPLISISGYTDYILLKHKDRLTPEITNDLKTVQRNVYRLETLMDQLLDVMKIDEDQLVLQKETRNVSRIINDCLDELSYLINEKNLEIILDINHEIILEVDPERLFTAFTNLISNAIKFTPHYGWIEITAKKQEDKYLFEVKDNGIGLSEEDLGKLFKKFERLKQPNVSENIDIKDTGTGLGLYITKGIINLHGGKIWANSDGENKGSKFSFNLPI